MFKANGPTGANLGDDSDDAEDFDGFYEPVSDTPEPAATKRKSTNDQFHEYDFGGG